MTLQNVPAAVRTELGDAHVAHLLRSPWGLAIARNRATSCAIRPETTRPAYAVLARLLASEEPTA